MRKYEQLPQGAAQASITRNICCKVYGLHSTKDGVIRYIGQTMQRELSWRRTQHLAEALRPPGTSACHRWIRKVLRTGYDIGIQLLEAECPWNEAEKRWIAIYRARYPDLMTNLSNGGCGYVGKRSLATRLKMSKPKSAATRAKMRKPKSALMRARLSRALIGNSRARGEKNYFASLTAEQVIDIKERLQRRESLSQIAARYGVQKAAISKIKTGRSWRHITGLCAPVRR